MKLSQHARTRMFQRCGIKKKNRQNNEFKMALKRGFDINDFKGEFKGYLVSKLYKQRGKGIKVYNNKIFLYAINSKKLITVLNVPEEMGDYKLYLVKKIQLKDNKPILRKYNKNKKYYLEQLNTIKSNTNILNSFDILELINKLKSISVLFSVESENYIDYPQLYNLVKKRCDYVNNICFLLQNSYEKMEKGEVDLNLNKNKKFYKCRVEDISKFLEKEETLK